ncbi:hypothetical protein BGX29_008543, partial [Mortierella sp. GBA35]
SNTGEGDGDNDDSGVLARMQEPLTNLEYLMMWDIGEQTATSDILSVFARCPNIRDLGLRAFKGDQKIDVIGRSIGKACVKIRALRYYSNNSAMVGTLPFRIMDALPPQQLEQFICHRFSPSASDRVSILALQRHSRTLREVVLNPSSCSARISISVVFEECTNLESLEISCSRVSGAFITLDDALERLWVFTKLSELSLSIGGCELPVEPGVQPYYARPHPIVFSDIETEHFVRLEELYRRIGQLKDLKDLTFTLVPLNEHGQLDQVAMDKHRSFPAMLSLGNVWSGRPRYLHYFARLSKLGNIRGSVNAGTEETKVTTGWMEAT